MQEIKPMRRIVFNIRISTCIILLSIFLLTSCELGYRNDGKEVTYCIWNEGTGFFSPYFKKVDADPKTFEDLGDGYAHDNRHAFFEGDIIKHADGATFKRISSRYAVDATHVIHYDTIMPTADPKTFKVHSEQLTEDAKDYYWYGRAIHVADKSSFVVLGDINNWETYWAKDKVNGYCMGYDPVPLADYESFKPAKTIGFVSGYYAVDTFQVYFKDHVVEGADPATFREVDFFVGQDRFRVYNEWHSTEVKDYSKLKRIGHMFSDGSCIYDRDLQKVENADPSSFTYIDGGWYVDKLHVWHFNKIVKDADVKTFEPVYAYSFFNGRMEKMSADWGYGKDAKHVFWQDSIIVGADPETFEKIDFCIESSWTVFDKNRIYEGEDSERLQKYLKNKAKQKTKKQK
ncbi:MAG: DKNYY domain-containing protein [Bacteroidaceae bacterium]|nr:DKNYY domain-containing protein [Bacteroidaceae bacterium]